MRRFMRRPVGIEQLEDRRVMSAEPWQDARHLTLSFAPDGAAIAGHTSNLFAALDQPLGRDLWKREMLMAFQTWASQANIDLGLVADSGDPFGTAGKTVGDPRFGDVRIGGQPMSSGVLSVSVPHDSALGGTWAGDVLFNTDADFSSAARLRTVALHEAGHVLGLEHSSDPLSIMYSHEGSTRTTLSSGDIAALRAIYGTRARDAHDLEERNDSRGNATRLKYSNFDGSAPLMAFGDITNLKDVDYFELRVLDGYTGPVTFRLRTAGLSLLSAQLTILDETGRVLRRAQTDGQSDKTVAVTLNSVERNGRYFIKVNRATQDVFGIGRFGLAVTFDSRVVVSPEAIDQVLVGPYESLSEDDLAQLCRDPDGALVNNDLHSDDNFITATELESASGFPENTRFQAIGSFADSVDVDFYKVRSARSNNGQVTLTATLLSLDDNAAPPRVTLLDRNLKQVPSTVLAQGDGTYIVQATSLRSDSHHYLRVVPDAASPVSAQGNYSLIVRFGGSIAALKTFAEGRLSPSDPQQGTLYVGREQLFQFLLAVSNDAPLGARVTVTIRDAVGNIAFRLTTARGDTTSGRAVFLVPGTYSIRVEVEGTDDAEAGDTAYLFSGLTLDQPIGPALEDPTLTPLFVDPLHPNLFKYPIGVVTPSPYFFFFPRTPVL
jgi:hypothetical protein